MPAQGGVDAGRAVTAAALGMDQADILGQGAVGDRPRALRPTAPGVVAAGGLADDRAPRANRPDLAIPIERCPNFNGLDACRRGFEDERDFFSMWLLSADRRFPLHPQLPVLPPYRATSAAKSDGEGDDAGCGSPPAKSVAA